MSKTTLIELCLQQARALAPSTATQEQYALTATDEQRDQYITDREFVESFHSDVY